MIRKIMNKIIIIAMIALVLVSCSKPAIDWGDVYNPDITEINIESKIVARDGNWLIDSNGERFCGVEVTKITFESENNSQIYYVDFERTNSFALKVNSSPQVTHQQPLQDIFIFSNRSSETGEGDNQVGRLFLPCSFCISMKSRAMDDFWIEVGQMECLSPEEQSVREQWFEERIPN